MVPISQALKQILMGSTGELCYPDFQRRDLALGIASAIDTHILDIWTEPDSKIFSGVLCLLWNPLQNECDNRREFKEGVQKALDMWKNMLHKDRLEAPFV